MTISPSQVEARAVEIGRLYADAAETLIRLIATRLGDDLDAPDWAARKLRELQQLQREINAEILKLSGAAGEQLRLLIPEAFETGVEAALADLRAAGITIRLPGTNVATVEAFVSEAIGQVESTHLGIFRQTVDVYRQAVTEGADLAAAGVETRRQATQRVVNTLADSGITGFRDSAGRNWGLDTYAEMTTRTALGRSAVQGHLNTLEANGQDLVIVSDSPEECPLCRPWEGQILSISGRTSGSYRTGDGGRLSVAGSVSVARAAGLFHPNCVPGDTLVSGPAKVAAFSRWYEGEVIIFRTAGGNELTITPNHPILTPEGWVAAGLLNEGDEVVRYIAGERMMKSAHPDDVEIPARIEDVFCALRESSEVPSVVVPVTAEDFHGDGFNSQVDVVWANSELRNEGESGITDPLADDQLGFTVGLPGALFTKSTSSQIFRRSLLASTGAIRSPGQRLSVIGRHSLDTSESGFSATDRSPGLQQVFADGGLADSEDTSQLILSLTGSIAFDKIVDLRRSEGWSGHVYNLQTVDGWYACNSIITHNCTHRLGLFVDGLTKRMQDTPNPEGYEDRQRQRELERNIRRWKRREQAAMTDSEREKAGRHLKDAQQRMRDFISETERRRQYDREQITT